jgi:hypothetical protein
MSAPPREVCIISQNTITANGNGPVIVMPAFYGGAILFLTAGIPTGTSPTLDVFIQQGFTAQISTDSSSLDLTNTALPTIWDDYLHFTQLTFNAAAQSQVARIMAFTGTGTNVSTTVANAPTANFTAAQSGALAAGVCQPGPLGMFWRVLWKVGGTSPSWPTLTITGQFLTLQG